MPLIQGKVNEEVFTPTQKTEIASNLTDDTASIEGRTGAPSPGSTSKRFSPMNGRLAGWP